MPSLLPVIRRSLALPLALALIVGVAPAHAIGPGGSAAEFPPGYEGYHTYAEMVAELDAVVADHPGIVTKLSIGESYEGRPLWAAKISDNVAVDEQEPEALFDSLTHGREHLTVEMNLYLLKKLTDGYGADPRITRLVDSREIWLIFMLNPDGGEHDISGDEFAGWRKNRQPIPGSDEIGIDLNRNFGFKWGCCNGSSGEPEDETYRGWSAWAAPEVRAYRDFIRSRVVDGRQQIRVAISWHSSSELILWPYGYAEASTVRTMTADDRATFLALGRAMAETNGYTAQQSRELYTTDGDQISWSHYEQRIFHFTFEMFPAEIEFYPTDEHIAPETARNLDAVLYLLEQADCPYRAAGLGLARCGPLSDDFEIDRGWLTDPFGTDTATDGRLTRATPATARDGDGLKQRERTASGERAIVSGPAGGHAASDDIDGGVTSVASPAVTLAAGHGWRLGFRGSFAHDRRASAADFVRLSAVDEGGRRTVLWERLGRPENANAWWTARNVSLDRLAGTTFRLLFEAADGAGDNVVEAALDDVRVYRATPGVAPNSMVLRTVVPGLFAG